MASASNQTFDVGCPIETDDSSDSSNFSDEDLKKKPEVPRHEKISIEKTVRKSRPKSVSQETVRDSSISSVSSQTSTASVKTKKKRKKNKSAETARDASIPSVSSQTSTSSKTAQGKNKSAETARDASIPSVSSQTSTSSKTAQGKNKSAVEKKPQAKTNTDDLQIAKELTCIDFPLKDDYDFRLVCSGCLIKEGATAFHLKNVSHTCAMDQLAIKKKSKSDWLLVRNPPGFNGYYKICLDFKSGVNCLVKPCTFAHGEGERLIWTSEQKNKFKLDTFIKKLRKTNVELLTTKRQENKNTKDVNTRRRKFFGWFRGKIEILTSRELAEVKSKNTYIPGLSTPRESSTSSKEFVSGTIPTNMPSTTRSSPVAVPRPNGDTKISFITSKNIVQPSSKPKPIIDFTDFQKSHTINNPDQNGYTAFNPSQNKNIPIPSLDPAPIKNLTNFPQLVTTDNPDPITLRYEQSYTDSIAASPKTAPTDSSRKMVSVESWPFIKDENPLKGTHDFQMFCSECFPTKALPHNCVKNILAFAEKGTSNWLPVRERRKVNKFSGKYVLCKSVGGERSLCKFGKENCSYAHNTIELALWNGDKQEQFDLTSFIYSHSSIRYRIDEFVRKYGTSFSYICIACFQTSNQIVYENKKNSGICNGLKAHNWASNKTLFYDSEKKLIKKALKNIYFYKECFNRNCRQTCSSAHSCAEREVWMLLRDAKITEETFFNMLKSSDLLAVRNGSQPIFRTPCPYKLQPLCKRCSSNGQNVTHKKCGHSLISSGLVYKTNPGLKQINNLPNNIPKNYYFVICNSLKKNKCQYPGICTFAHSQEEIDVWQWMCSNKVKTLEEIISYQEKQSTEVVKGMSSISQTVNPATEELPVPHYCQFCGMSYRNKMEWENHCTTNEHNTNVSYDQEQQWNYREPPWNYLNEKELQLCVKHERGQCLYSNILDMYNLCPYAHGNKELEEWKKRFEWRALKTDLAKKPHIMSYILGLQDFCLNSLKPFLLMNENIPDVELQVDGEKNVFSTMKKFSHTWNFIVISLKRQLQKVSLLHDKDRLYFALKTDFHRSNFQVLDAHRCKLEDTINYWKVTVNFNSKMYGSFSQRVIFDFGETPLLFQDLTVDVGTHKELHQLLTIRDQANFELWAPENREIIFLQRTTNLLNKYKRPVNIKDIVTQEVLTPDLNRHNYVQKMHKLLLMEEFACHQKMSRYNLCADMIVSETIDEESTFLNCQQGILFGDIPLSEELSEDTEIGRMILTSCTSVYIALPMSSSKVYEVEIVTDTYFNFKGQRRNNIYVVLTSACIHYFKLSPGVVKKVELQFGLNRQSFCLMHFALDNMDSIDIVFPDPVKNILSLKTKPTKCSSKFLNKEQLIAVKYILGQRANFLCPFILNGAYGTGKTETLAQATMQLLDTQPDAKILICTQCNSSADLFILKHLDEYMNKKEDKKMLLRMYYSGRHVMSVPYAIRKYTLMSQDQFRKPEKKDFDHARVVIATLENCHRLIKLQLKGTFTHIFIDEAAQEFETKVLLPLTLATKDTCVVLSGDHHQMGIKIHSAEARRQGLGISIMQRLFEHYANHPYQDINADSPLHTLLVHNYRSVKEISQFISTCFYGILTNPQEQKAPSSVSGLKPLQFYAVSGLETHNHNSPSYYNEKEVNQIVDCVIDISSNWPEKLGSFDPRHVCIVSSYRDQVILIRRCLRKKSASLSQIVVEQVRNIPGKEFKVIIISTVRTSNFLDITPEKLANYSDEADELDFFYDKKLLNTAMTRAQYSIIAVGDPVALCAYGKCSTIWRIFINHCSKLCSVKPSEITYDIVRLEVNMLLSSRKKPVQPTGANWASEELPTGIHFSTESFSSNATNVVNNQEIYGSVAHGWSDANDWNCPWSKTYSLAPITINDSSETENHEAVGQDQIKSQKPLNNSRPNIHPVDPVLKNISSKTVQQVKIEGNPLNNSRPNIHPVDPVLKNISSKTVQQVQIEGNPLNNSRPNIHPVDPVLKNISSKTVQQVQIEGNPLNNSRPNIHPVDPVLKNISSKTVQQVKIEGNPLNNSRPNIHPVDPVLKNISSKTVQQVQIEGNPLNNSRPNIHPVDPVLKNISSKTVQQVQIEGNPLNNSRPNIHPVDPVLRNISSETVQQVQIEGNPLNNSRPNIHPVDPVLKNISSKTVQKVQIEGNPLNNSRLEKDPVDPVLRNISSKNVSPNIIQQVLIEDRKPDIDPFDPVSKNEPSKTASPKADKEIQLEASPLPNRDPKIDPIDPISKNSVSSKTSSNPDPLHSDQIEAGTLNNPRLKIDPIDPDPQNASFSEMASPDILQLDWNRPHPLNYPKSKIDSLFCLSEDKSCSKITRINFSFPCVYVVQSPMENLTIGLSFYKVGQHFIVGIHWPDLQSYIPKENSDDASTLETVLVLDPKHRLSNVPELYFTSDHTIGTVSCLIKVDREGKISDCSFHQTLIKPEKIVPITELENHLQINTNKQELNFPNYLQKLANIWCKLRLGNESLHIKNPLTDYPKSNRLLTEIFIQVHIQIVRFLSKVFPETTPTAWQSFGEGPKLDQWKREHVSDALNSVLLLQPYFEQGKVCNCNVFCKCLLDYIRQKELKLTIPQTLEINLNTWQLILNSVDENRFEDAQQIILSPFYHDRIAVALKKISDLTQIKFRCSDNVASDYGLNFDPQVYFCKPSISFLDLLVQKMLVAAVHKLPNPVTIEEVRAVTEKLTETIAAKQMQQKDAFFKKLRKDFPDQTIETQATVVSVNNSTVEIMLPRIAFWSYYVSLDVLGSSSTPSDICTLQFTQIDANVLTYSSSTCAAEIPAKKIESPPTICINVFNWQRILSYLRSQDFSNMKNCVHTAKNMEVLKKEPNHPGSNISAEISYSLDVYPYLNFQASVKIVEDLEGRCKPQLQLLHLSPDVSLCLLHRNNPLKYFLPERSMELSEYQRNLLTEVYRLAIGQHRSIILRDVALLPENQFWIFSIPLIILQDHGICLEPDVGADEHFLSLPLPNMICVRFSLMSENVKSTRVFHGYICKTDSCGLNVKVSLCMTDDANLQLVELQNQKCNIVIHCWTPVYRSMADSILNLSAASPLAQNIVSRQLNPVKSSNEIFSVFEENEFAVITSDNSYFSLTHLMRWFEYYASILLIRETATKSSILICTPTENELDIIIDCLQTENLLSKINVIRVAEVSDESQPSCTSLNKIFLHEKLYLFNEQLMEEMNAFAEIYGQSFYPEDSNGQSATETLLKADVILCTCLTSRRSVVRSVSSYIKQMIIFNAHLCPEVEAMIPISYFPIERLGLFSSSESALDTSIANRLLQSCPHTKYL